MHESARHRARRGGDRGGQQPQTRHGHPLRHPAARGRVAAGAHGGRRPRDVRRQVRRRRPGPQGARRGGARGRAGPPARTAGARRSCTVEVDPVLGRARARRGGPGPAPGQRRAQPRRWTSCRARSASTRSCTCSTRTWPAGCCGSTRSSATSTAAGATPTCCCGTASSSSSTTGRAWCSTTPGRGPRAPPPGRTTPPTTSSRSRPPAAPQADAALAPQVTRELLDDVVGARAGPVAGRGAGLRRPRRGPGGVRRPPAAAGRRAPGVGAVTRRSSSTPCCAPSRASSGASASTSGSSCTARSADLLRAVVALDEPRLRALDPDVDVDGVREAAQALAPHLRRRGPGREHVARPAVPLAHRPAQHGRAGRAGAQRAHRATPRPRSSASWTPSCGRRCAAPRELSALLADNCGQHLRERALTRHCRWSVLAMWHGLRRRFPDRGGATSGRLL